MSELKNQLQSLRKGIVLSNGLQQVPSLFVTSAEAAKIQISTVYETAIRSLHILAQYDSRLNSFTEKNQLLHASSVSLQRELKTQLVN